MLEYDELGGVERGKSAVRNIYEAHSIKSAAKDYRSIYSNSRIIYHLHSLITN